MDYAKELRWLHLNPLGAQQIVTNCEKLPGSLENYFDLMKINGYN